MGEKGSSSSKTDNEIIKKGKIKFIIKAYSSTTEGDGGGGGEEEIKITKRKGWNRTNQRKINKEVKI